MAAVLARFGTSGRAAATYVVLAALQRGISLLILPFITHAMPPVEYGAVSMLVATSLLLTAFVATPLIQLVVRAGARQDDDGPALLRVGGTYCYFVLPVIGAIGAAAFALCVPELLGVSGSIWAIELLAIGLQPASSTFAMWVAQSRADLRPFVWLSLTTVVATTVSKLVLVVVLRQGVSGWVLSDLISAVMSALLAIALIRLPRRRIRMEHVRYVLRFVLPLVPHSLSVWALTSLSRPAMAAVSSLEQVGYLAFGLSLASLAALVLAEANRAALPHYSRETLPAPTPETLRVVRWQIVGAFSLPAIVGCGVAVAGQWLFAEAYWPSFFLTGVLLVGQTAYGLYLIPMNYLTQTAGHTKYSAAASGAGAVVILGFILLLGHRYGAVGAACATAAGYATMAAVAVILTKTHNLTIAWRSWLADWKGVVLSLAALICSVFALASPVGSTFAWVLSGASLLSTLGAVISTARRT